MSEFFRLLSQKSSSDGVIRSQRGKPGWITEDVCGKMLPSSLDCGGLRGVSQKELFSFSLTVNYGKQM